MPYKKEQFVILKRDLSKEIDVDDSAGRSVPINMNFVETGFLTKDTGSTLFGATETLKAHSLFNYKKKDGTSYQIRVLGTKLQKYNSTSGLWEDTTKTVTADKEFGYIVYDDILYCSNTAEMPFTWDGTTFTDVAAIPKGNILEVFEDRLFVSGVPAEPLTIYYSNVGDFTTFSGTSLVKPLGTDKVTHLENYYGQLLIFKRDTIWKLTFQYDQITSLYIPKIELQSGNYGATSKNAVTWVENDIWFFTGREVRAIGFKDQQTGVLGVNASVISDNIKETLFTMSITEQEKAVVFYHNRKFYLSVPIIGKENDTVFVCHLLYKNNWTKYSNRIKASISDFMVIDDVIYTTKSVAPYGVLKWDSSIYDDNGVAVNSEVFFKKIEDKDFNKFNIYRYLDLMFKNLQGKIKVTIKQDANDLRSEKTKTFFIGQGLEDELGSLGETDVGEVLVADSFGQSIESAPFLKNRISFLSKAQTLTIGLSSSNAGETFTIAEFALYGTKEPRKEFAPKKIISVN